MANPKQKSGLTTISIIFAGQFISLLASNASQFGLTLWIFEETGKATIMSVTSFFYITPFLALSPFAGTLIDRYNRKVMMMMGDVCSFVATSIILALLAGGVLAPWHLYITSVLFGIGNAFQWPAYAAAISTLVSKEQFGRANGMLSLIDMGSAALAPALAGYLLPVIGLKSILIIDVLTFFIAVGVLLFVHIPQPERTSEEVQPRHKILDEALYGFQYIRSHLELRVLLVFSFLASFLLAFNYVCPAMVFLRTGNDSLQVGSVLSSSTIGFALGGLVMTISGGWKRRITPVLLSPFIYGIASIVMGMATGLPVWLPTNALRWIFVAMANASNLAIWQAKVAEDVQGRVFAARRVLIWFSEPFVPIMASSLGDYVLEPAMQGGGTFSRLFDGLVGNGPGAGMALVLVFMGAAMIALSVIGSRMPALRNIEMTQSPE
jgi:DHA3 family macrolide efflux protein-like MFS transporter